VIGQDLASQGDVAAFNGVDEGPVLGGAGVAFVAGLLDRHQDRLAE
jgi:hypothetical protein